MGASLLWIWRVLLLAILAYGVWGIWWQNVQLESINVNLLQLLDYLEFEPEFLEEPSP
jgi:hypothetical protein